ncbi:Tenascin-N [Holothuria leucospilota]|uniref:Tenascin-N n=1 Tax=Holothuria leucospilota TaxID=206669 RepID=A0A9Q1BVQ3_HOLLE|nr:Tenascin-N [Holothuria leucospilota]
MALSLSMGFTTFDHDVDFKLSHNCASTSGGGWWYNGGNTGWCYHANLNGIYGDERIQSAIIWYIGSGFEYKYLVKSVEMKIRPT